MKPTPPTIDLLIEPLSACLTEETARRLVSLKPNRKLEALVEKLGRKSSEGTLTDQEREEYGRYVSFGTFIAMLKSKARLLLAESRIA
jgi:hypothetical protein